MTRDEATKTIMTHVEHWHRLLRDKICDETEGKETIEAFLMAIEALKQTQWIPCDKELPLYMQRVLVTFHNDQTGEDRIKISYCYMQTNGFFSDRPVGYKALAWMPLPKAYEGGTE